MKRSFIAMALRRGEEVYIKEKEYSVYMRYSNRKIKYSVFIDKDYYGEYDIDYKTCLNLIKDNFHR